MSGILTRFLVIVGLLVGAAAHGLIVSAVTGGVAASLAGMDVDCDMTNHGKMKPADCASICAAASADLVGMASLWHPLTRPSWQSADRSADGVKPSPDPTPPRA